MSGSGRGREIGLVLGVSLVTVVVMVAVWSLVRASQDPPTATAGVHSTSTDPDDAHEDEVAGPRKGVIETYEVFAPKDPFEPLLAGQGGKSSPVATGTGEGVVTTNFDNDPAEAGFHHEVRVVEVDRGSAVISIDGTNISVHEGEIFAERFQLLSVADNCASILFGDDQFTLCEGEKIFK